MIEQFKSVMQQIGQGLSVQHMGEMSATVEQIDRRSRNFQLAGGQGRIVLIASTAPLGPAFDFVVDLAKQSRSIIEVLYVTPAGETKSSFNSLLNKLGDLSCDFQITYLTGNLYEKIAGYSTQREDIMSVVCSSIEPFTEELKSAPQTLEPELRFTFPTVLLIGSSIMA